MIAGVLESKKRASQVVGLQPNTFIGGVATSIPDAASLASKLNISSADITYFNKVGSDIEAYINITYTIQNACFDADLNISYYKETENKCQSVDIYAFRNTFNMEYAEFVGQTFIQNQSFGGSTANVFIKDATSVPDGGFIGTDARFLYLVNVVNLGSSAGNNSIFNNLNPGTRLYVHPSLATNNGGAPDGDIQHAISLGAIIRYVNDFTKPEKINDLSISEIYGTSFKLDFTTPYSANALDFYQVYVNDKLNSIYSVEEDIFAINLLPSTAYQIKVVAVDEFHNLSEASNTVNQNTSASYIIPTSNIFSNIKFEENVSDGVHVITPTNIFYEPGLVGKQAVFDGSTSKIIIDDADDFSFTDGIDDKPFTVIIPVIFNSKVNQMLICKRDNPSSTSEWELDYTSGQLRFLLMTPNSQWIGINHVFNPNLGQRYFLVFAYGGSKSEADMVMYNSTEKLISESNINGNYTGMQNTSSKVSIGVAPWFNGWRLNGKIDEMPFFNKKLSIAEISDCIAKIKSGQHLT